MGWIPGRKAAGELPGLRPAGQTGLRVEVVLSFPTAPLRRDRGKSPRKPMFSELRTPRKLCWRHNFRPPARSRRKARTTNNPAEVCPTGRNRRRSPAAFLVVPDGKLALARGGNPDGFRRLILYSIKRCWRQQAAISQELLSVIILMTLSVNLGDLKRLSHHRPFGSRTLIALWLLMNLRFFGQNKCLHNE